MRPSRYGVTPAILDGIALFFAARARLADLCAAGSLGRSLRERLAADRIRRWQSMANGQGPLDPAALRGAFETWARPQKPLPVGELILEVERLLDGGEAGLRGMDQTPPLALLKDQQAQMVAPEPDEIVPRLVAIDGELAAAPRGEAQTLLAVAMAHARLLLVCPLPRHNLAAATALSVSHLSHRRLNPGGLLALDGFLALPERAYQALDVAAYSDDGAAWLEVYLATLTREIEDLLGSARSVAKDLAIKSSDESATLNDRQKRALVHIREAGRITNRVYRKLFGVSNRTAHLELSDLVGRRLVRRVGFGRAVEYV